MGFADSQSTANNGIERTRTNVLGWHAPGFGQSRTRKARVAPRVIRALGVQSQACPVLRYCL